MVIDKELVAVFLYNDGGFAGQPDWSSKPPIGKLKHWGDRMNARLVRDSLVVVIDGDEIPGITMYGLARAGGSRRAVFPADAWIGAPLVDEFILRGDSWEIVTWDVPILVWPTVDEMRTAVRTSLASSRCGLFGFVDRSGGSSIL